MKCDKCGFDYEEKQLQESHDVPCWLFSGDTRQVKKNQADKHGRHWLCNGKGTNNCHAIYDNNVLAWVISSLPDSIRDAMITSAERFSKSYFPRKQEIKTWTN